MAECGGLYFDADGNLVFSGCTGTNDVVMLGPIASTEYPIDILLVGGGGGTGPRSGGGGAGGFRYLTGVTTGFGSYTITVGAGGTATATNPTNDGGDSSLIGGTLSYTADGGGGAGIHTGTAQDGRDGGSGGGGAGSESGQSVGGTGTAGQGYDGGDGWLYDGYGWGGGGGGGASQAGADAIQTKAGDGGDGEACSITGSEVYYAGGGGGGCHVDSGGAGSGGTGGGGDGTNFSNPTSNTNGTDGLGGGAGGGSVSGVGRDGGDGVVIVRYLTSNFPSSTGGNDVITDGDYTVRKFTSNGTLTLG